MKSKQSSIPWNIGLLVLAFAIGLAGPCDSAQVKKMNADGTNDALDQEAVLKRDPFWPIGYVSKNSKSVIRIESPKVNSAVVENSWSEAMKKVVINGVSSSADNEYCAIINTEVKSVGDTVTINHGNTIYTWAVENIEPPGSVKLRRVSAK